MEFGFVPRKVVQDLQDIGNWKVRADAVELLQFSVSQLSKTDVPRMRPRLPELMRFLGKLLTDPNFKISLTTLQVLSALVDKLDHELERHVAVLMPGLVEKLGDSKIVVRQANLKVLNKLILTARSGVVIEGLVAGLKNGVAQVREEIVNVFIHVLLTAKRMSTDVDTSKLVSALGAALKDSSPRVRQMAVEALAVAASLLGTSRVGTLLDQLNMDSDTRIQLKERFSVRALPSINAEGLVEHCAHTGLSQGPAGGSSQQEQQVVSSGRRAVPVQRSSRQDHMGGSLAGAEDARGMQSLSGDLLMKRRKNQSPPRIDVDPALAYDASLLSVRSEGTRDALKDSLGSTDGEWLEAPLSTGTGVSSGRRFMGSGRISVDESRVLSGGRPGRRDQALDRGHSLGTPLPESNRSSSAETSTSDKGPVWLSQTPANAHARDSPLRSSHNAIPARRRENHTSLMRAGSDDLGADFIHGDNGHGHGHASGGSLSMTVDPSLAHGHGLHVNWLNDETPVGATVPPNYGSSRASSRANSTTPNAGPQVGDKLNLLKRNILSRNMRSPGAARAGCGAGAAAPSAPGLPDPRPEALHIPRDVCDAPLPTNSTYPPYDDADAFDTNAELAAPRRTPQSSLATARRRQRQGLEEASDPADVRFPVSTSTGGLASPDGYCGRHFAQGGLATPSSFANRSETQFDKDDFLKPSSKQSRPPSNLSTAGGVPQDVPQQDLRKCEQPESTLRSCMQALTLASTAKPKEVDWEAQCQGILDARRLTAHHMEVVLPSLHALLLVVLPAVDSLRSYLAKSACQLLFEMACAFRNKLDTELEYIVPALIKKGGEASFLSSEADRVLSCVVENTTDSRCLSSLLGSAQHKNSACKVKVGFHIDRGLQICGPRVFSGASGRDLVERLFNTVIGYLEEGSVETRTMGKRILWRVHQMTSASGDFDRLMKRVSNEAKARQVRAVLEGQLPDLPAKLKPVSQQGRAPPSRQPRAQTRSGVGVESDSTLRVDAVVNLPNTATGTRADSDFLVRERRAGLKAPQRTRTGSNMNAGVAGSEVRFQGTASMIAELEELPVLLNQVTSKDWRERSNGLKALEEMVLSCPYIPESQLVNMFDHLVQRLSDGNSKVNIQTLQVLTRIFPALGESTGAALNTLVPSLVANLGSTNEKIRNSASEAVDSLIRSMDSSALLQNFAHCVNHGGLRAKHIMLEKLTTMVPEVYSMNHTLLVKYVLPAAFSLLSETKGEIRSANSRLLKALHRTMGSKLREHTGNLSAALMQRLEDLLAS